MKKLSAYLGALLMGFIAGLIICVVTHFCGGSDFLCGAFTMIAFRAVFDAMQ